MKFVRLYQQPINKAYNTDLIIEAAVIKCANTGNFGLKLYFDDPDQNSITVDCGSWEQAQLALEHFIEDANA